MRVLLVDDEVSFLNNTVSLLQHRCPGWEILGAKDAEEAVQILEQSELDVLITDIRMPGKDGIWLLTKARELRPGIAVIVVTAFPSPELSREVLASGALRFLEKPLDLEDLVRTVERLAQQGGWQGQVASLELFDIAQLMVMAGRTVTLEVRCDSDQGFLVFSHGQLVHASTSRLAGEEAFFSIASWEGGHFQEKRGGKKHDLPRNITMPTMELLLEAAKRRDEAVFQEGLEPPFDLEPAGSGEVAAFALEEISETPRKAPTGQQALWRDVAMAIKDLLETFRQVDGFLGAAVFAPDGSPVETLTAGKIDIAAVGALANNALLNAQKATDQMGIGRGNFVVIKAPQGQVVMRCYNEATDFSTTAAGKAHFHTVVALSADGNVGLTGMLMDKVVSQIADLVR